jgi:hypothetical protein
MSHPAYNLRLALLRVVLVAATLLCAACHDAGSAWTDDPTLPRDSADRVLCYYDFRLSLADDDLSTRADGDLIKGTTYTDYRGRTIDENALNTLHVFVVDAEANGTEDWAHSQHLTVLSKDITTLVDETKNKQTATATVHFYVTPGWKHIYVGANLRSELVEAVLEGTNTYRAPASEDYDAVISHFVDPDFGVAMFAMDTLKEDLSTLVDPVKYNREVTLHRMAAKVLLTCDSRDGTYADINFANITSQTSSDEAYEGWCRIESVRYKLQATNRATYFIQKRDADGNVMDPNYKVSELIRWTGAGAEYLDDRAADIVFLGSDDIYDFSDSPRTYQTVERYISGQEAQDYPVGFYCLENTCDNDWTYFLDRKDLPYALAFWRMAPAKVIPSLIVQAQYTPALIYTAACFEGLNGNDTPEPEKFTDIDKAKAKLIKERNTDEDTEELATFYCINGRYCYTYKGMQASLDYYAKLQSTSDDEENPSTSTATTTNDIAADPASYQKFTNGYCYYQEYFTDLPLSNLGKTSFSGVERNKYYLLHCTSITAPTTTETGVEVIKVWSTWGDWEEAGENDTAGDKILPTD